MMESRFSTMLDQMDEELNDAQKYTKCASATKADMPDVADMYMRMANQEMEHANHLHNAIDKLVRDERVPHDLRAVWDWQNQKYMRWAEKIRMKMEMAKR